MKRGFVKYFVLSLFIGSFLLQCDKNSTDSDDNGNDNSLTGTWTATKFEFTNKNNPSQKVDLVQQGFTISIELEQNGNYALTISTLGQVIESEEGTYSVDGNEITLDPEGDDPVTTEFTLSDNTLEISIDNAEWDFDNDGNEESATLDMVFEKQ